jgi:hypothetical protein
MIPATGVEPEETARDTARGREMSATVNPDFKLLLNFFLIIFTWCFYLLSFSQNISGVF